MGGRRLVAVGALVVLVAAAAAVVARPWLRDDAPHDLRATLLPGGASLWQGPCGERGLVDAGAAPADLDRHLDPAAGPVAWVYSSGRDDVQAVAPPPVAGAAVAYEAEGWDADAANRYVAWARDAEVPRESVAPGDRFGLCADAGDDAVVFEVADGGCLKVTHQRFVLATCGEPGWLGRVDVAVPGDDPAWIDAARPTVIVAEQPDADRVGRWEAFAEVYPLGRGSAPAGEVTVATTGQQRFTVTGPGRLARAHPIGHGGAARTPRAGFDGDPATTARIGWGVTQEAGLRVSEARFPDQTAAHVVIAQTGEAAGSLIGATLTKEGPLLHVRPGWLPGSVRREIRRVLPDGGTVYLIGAATGDAVADPLREDGFDVVELSGPNRILTSLVAAEELLSMHPGDEVALVPGWATADDPTGGWGDVVAAVAWAAAHDVPVVLTRSDRLPTQVAEALARWRTQRVWLFGNEDALAPAVADAVPGPVRVTAGDPASAAVAVADQLWGGSSDRYMVVNAFDGDGWLAALPAAGLAADFRAPVLVTDTARLPAATRRRVATCDPRPELLLLGGRVHLSERVERALEAVRRESC